MASNIDRIFSGFSRRISSKEVMETNFPKTVLKSKYEKKIAAAQMSCFLMIFPLCSTSYFSKVRNLDKTLYSAVLLLCCTGVLLGGTSPKSIVAARTETAPRIDGALTDEVWNLAVPVSG